MHGRRLRRKKPGSVADLSSTLWRAISHLEGHLDDTAKAERADVTELCKLSHALSQAAGVYLKALETGELEARLEALERAQSETQGNSYRRVA